MLRNFKLIATLSLAYMVLSTIFLSVFSFTSESILRDMLVKESFLPISSFPGSEKDLSVKELLFRVLKSWIRPLITMLYNVAQCAYFVVVFLIGIVAYIIYLYLSVVWIVGIVVSVVEEDCYGFEALGKAGKIVKGNRLVGLVYNVLLNLVTLVFVVFVQESRIITGHNLVLNKKVFLFITVSLSCLLRVFQFVGFTVFYFQCKKHHGEEIELQGSVEVGEYAKIPITPLDNDIP
ncbi:hypothetical protein Leryth_012291 [Lithospermum erythrorhizon]|nr:hypothetical protein Leryth_012291 [Lithospermum erythrorhizon]